jgi:nucleotide-binding universal stress UspA family protein
MFDKLLLPVDPSKRLKPSREYAIALAKRLNIPLTAIFVSNPSKTGTMTASDETSKGFATLGKRQLDILVEGITDVKITPMLKTGKRRKVLAQMISDGIADTLVLGPFRSVITRLFTGSEVERILDSESSHAFVVREIHPLPGPGSPALVVFDGPELPERGLKMIESFARKFGCDIEFLHLGTETFGGAEALDGAVSELRTSLGGDFHITSTIIPLSLFRTRRAITNSVLRQEGARIVILPDVEDAVSDTLLHQLVLSAAVPVCVLR